MIFSACHGAFANPNGSVVLELGFKLGPLDFLERGQGFLNAVAGLFSSADVTTQRARVVAYEGATELTASQSLGDKSTARKYAMRARDSLSKLEQRWGSENYNTYLSRPDVQRFRKQLEQLTGAE